MDFLTKFVAAALARLAADEAKAWFPRLTEILINLAVRRLPDRLRDRYAEEWRAHVADTPGEMSRLFCAAGCLWAGWRVWERFKIDVFKKTLLRLPAIFRLVLDLTVVAILASSSVFFLKYVSKGVSSVATILIAAGVMAIICFRVVPLRLHNMFETLIRLKIKTSSQGVKAKANASTPVVSAYGGYSVVLSESDLIAGATCPKCGRKISCFDPISDAYGHQSNLIAYLDPNTPIEMCCPYDGAFTVSINDIYI